MRTRSKVVSIAAILSAAAVGGGVAQASAAQNAGAKPATEVAQSTDTDNVQQGDQTTPDVPAVHPASARVATHVASVSKTTSHVTVSKARGATASESAGESTGQGAESSSESEAANDGPGGHQDPPGDVQHEGGNNEQ
jgi:hypothetical protein